METLKRKGNIYEYENEVNFNNPKQNANQKARVGSR